jgi:hypothetical protein
VVLKWTRAVAAAPQHLGYASYQLVCRHRLPEDTSDSLEQCLQGRALIQIPADEDSWDATAHTGQRPVEVEAAHAPQPHDVVVEKRGGG